MDNTKPESADIAAPRSGPGRLLRQARLDLRLAPEDVAQILHLSSKQITALEIDDYQSLPGPTYVRGYLRSYAQLLGLTPEKVVEAYNNLTIPSKPILPPQSALPPQVTSSDRLVKAASMGVTAIVLGLVYLWWQSNDPPLEQASQSPTVAGQASVDVLPPQNVSGDISPSTIPANLPPANGGEPALQASSGATPVQNAAGPTTSPGRPAKLRTLPTASRCARGGQQKSRRACRGRGWCCMPFRSRGRISGMPGTTGCCTKTSRRDDASASRGWRRS